MKTKIEVQFQERNIDVKDTEKLVKENLKAAGVKMNTIVNLDIYYQPEEGDIYYVATTKDGKELSNEEALKIEEYYISINAKKLNSNYKGKDHLINIAMMNLQMILLSGFYFSFLGILNEIQAGNMCLTSRQSFYILL